MASIFAVMEFRTRVYTASDPQATAVAGNRQAKEITDLHAGHTSRGWYPSGASAKRSRLATPHSSAPSAYAISFISRLVIPPSSRHRSFLDR